MSLIALDLDGTLVDQAAAAKKWAIEFGTQWELTHRQISCLARALTTRRPKSEVFSEFAEDWTIPLAGDDVWALYRSRMPELVHCTEADKEALRCLRDAGWHLGIVTNGMANNQEGKIRHTGLDELVDGWVISAEVGCRKPDVRIFEILAERLGCRLDGWMIGDSLEHDVAGGHAAGLRTAWITGEEPPRHAGGWTVTARSVSAAAQLILSRQERAAAP